jgi:hypothetical protein
MIVKIIPDVKTCPVCQSTFEVGGTGRPKRTSVYCSKHCSATVRRRHPSCKELPEIQCAYIAGLIDADGHIGLYEHTNGKPRVKVQVTNTYEPVLIWMREVTGIGSYHEVHPETDKWKRGFYWSSSGISAASLIRQIQPYMIIKSERARLAVEYQDFIDEPANSLDLSKRKEYREKMLKLNRRGPEDDY